MNDTSGLSCFGTGLNSGLWEEIYRQWIFDSDKKNSLLENSIIPEKKAQLKKEMEVSGNSEIAPISPIQKFAYPDRYIKSLQQTTDGLKISFYRVVVQKG